MDDDESSEGDTKRLAMFQKQAKRRYLNKHKAQQESLASLPGYTSQAEAEGTDPPKYPPPAADKYTELTAEEADEERDEVGDVVRRVRLRRKRSGSDTYLDSLLARSVHALELSNALLQSSMTTQSSLSALLTREDQLDSHAQFLANQIHASDSRRVWVDDMSRQLDPGLSQSLPDPAGGFLAGETSRGLQRGDRPRSPPPRCMTVYADHAQDPDSILIPSTNGLRSAARVHDLSRNHSRRSSTSEEGLGWGTPPRNRSIYGIATASSPQLSTPAPRRASGRRTLSNVHLPPEPSSGYTSSVQSPNVQTTYSPSVPSPNVQTTSNQYLSSPVRPILSSVPAEPSTPAYNLLSAIVTRTPGTTTDSESEGRRLSEPRRPKATTSESRNRLAPPTDSRLSLDPRVPRIESQISPGLDKRPRHLSETDMGTVRGKGSGGWVAPMMLAGQKRGATGAGDVQSGNSSQSGSKPPTPSRTSTHLPAAHIASPDGPNRARGPSPSPSPNRGVRHPFLAGGRRRSISTEDDRAMQRYRSADALRRILDDAAAKRQQEQEQQEREREEEEARLAASEQQERGRKPLARPNWSVIPRRGTTVAVETVETVGEVSIEGITGTGGGGGGKRRESTTGKQLDPLVLPGEFWAGPVTAEPKSGLTTRQNTRQDTLTSPNLERQDTLIPERQDPLRPDSPTRQRSQSMGPRFGSLLPKISVFGKTGVGDPPVDKGKGKAVEAQDIPRSAVEERSRARAEDLSKTPVPGPSFAARLSVQLNGANIDPDTETTSSSSESECESQPSQASLPLPPRLFIDSTDSITRRPSSLRLPGSPRTSSFRQPGSGASTPRSVTFSPLPPKHVPSGGRPLSEAKTRRKNKDKNKEKEKPGWFASWFGPLPSSTSAVSGKYGVSSRRGWDSPRSMDDWQM
ncbi:hypothetical protein RSOLAG22IIIB_06875 [Rhizoctonia solani]|uniref:Uncharacterized protein n=1 Tax=Rhizoctonia solani TaxID=456999 RepID=A0A0K6GH38_9AGAM|nr:hypothetical protein RSOLAG22IIIB_06875 [Rhizoctonia solani]